MSQAVQNFIANLAIHFSKRHDNQDSEKQWLRAMMVSLRGFPAPVLDEAAQTIIRRHGEVRFPLPKECIKACEEAQDRLKLVQPLTQLRQMFKTVQSAKPPQEDQHHRPTEKL